MYLKSKFTLDKFRPQTEDGMTTRYGFYMPNDPAWFVVTGYIPITKTFVKTEIVKEQWQKYPQFKMPFEQLSIGYELPRCAFQAAFEDEMRTVCGALIQSREITAKEAVEQLRQTAEELYPKCK